jgi:prefoldin subunit 5
MVVGVIAVAALGVAAYALMQAGDDGGGGSSSGLATNERVSRLDDRIDRLSRQIQDARSGDNAGGDDAGERVEALERTVKTLAERPSTDPQEAIDQLSERIDDVANDVEALQQAQPAP